MVRAPVSLVFTVLNESASLPDLLESICAQTIQPDEVVVVDGGSTDGTVDIVHRFGKELPLRLAVEPGCTIAAGRNRAIAAARHDIVAVTDAGVRLGPHWLERIIAPLVAGEADVVSGFFSSAPRSVFELALGATTLPEATEIDPDRFLPSSRSVAFLRSAWQRAGGYPEWLDYGEDLVFDLKLRAAGCRFAWAPEAIVHFRPRPDLPAFFRQYYRYARGDGKANLWPRRHAVRYSAYGVLVAAGLLGRTAVWPWPLLLVAGAAYLRRPLLRLLPRLAGRTPRDCVAALALLPVLRATGDIAKMAGYPAGVRWRLCNAATARASGRPRPDPPTLTSP